VFTTWLNKITKAKKTPEKSTTTFRSDYMKDIREREQAEKKRREKWSKELKQNMNYNSNYAYSSSIGQLSGSSITSNTITTTTLGDSSVRIDGGENGRMLVDVPLIVDGRDVMKELDEMRDVLLLLKRDVDMEAKYPRLKELKDEYERALEKYKTFEALKESK